MECSLAFCVYKLTIAQREKENKAAKKAVDSCKRGDMRGELLMNNSYLFRGMHVSLLNEEETR